MEKIHTMKAEHTKVKNMDDQKEARLKRAREKVNRREARKQTKA